MPLYTTIAKIYEQIFPVNEKTLSFVGSPQAGSSVLDIGCATGGHCIALAKAGWTVTGIDPAPTMVEAANAAKSKLAEETAARIQFKRGGMQEVAAILQGKIFNLLLCTGNTVPHLSGESDLKSFLCACRSIMAPDGAMIIQLLNYAKILREKPDALPSVRERDFLFSREYRYGKDGSIAFDTRLETEGKIERDTTRLWPFTLDSLKRNAAEADLRITGLYGSWGRQVFNETEDMQLILELCPQT